MVSSLYFIGIDGGTESLRVGIFDQEGTPVGFASRTYTLKHPRPGWAEQDPDEWWTSLVAAVREGRRKSGIGAAEIGGKEKVIPISTPKDAGWFWDLPFRTNRRVSIRRFGG